MNVSELVDEEKIGSQLALYLYLGLGIWEYGKTMGKLDGERYHYVRLIAVDWNDKQ